jgi:hypothetical protein
MSNAATTWNLALGLLGAAVGAAVGYFGFLWAAHQGFYALMLPGALLGAGGGLLVKDKSLFRAAICSVLALALGLFAEWRFAPFIADQGPVYFLGHLHQLRALTILMVVLGGVFGFWLSLGKEQQKIPTTNS